MGDNTKKKSVVILGAGLAGLSAAWDLATNGFEVTILEKSNELGGLAQTKKRSGFEYDLGPHNIFSAHPNIIKFYQRTFVDLFKHFPKSIIIKNKKAVDHPLRGLRVLSVLPLYKTIPVALNFLVARVMMYLNPFPREKNYKDWIVNRFGYLLYREYFRNYSEKVWALPAERIDKYVALKRIPTVGLLELIRALFSKAVRQRQAEYDFDCFYLPHGIGQIPNFFSGELEAMGGEIVRRAKGGLINNIAVWGANLSAIAGAACGKAVHFQSAVGNSFG